MKKAKGFPKEYRRIIDRERPYGTEAMMELRASNLLPAGVVGVELIELSPSWHGVDPYVLYDRWGHILYQWPDGYVPHWLDVYEVCQGLGLLI